MTRLEKTIILANRRYAGLISDSIRKALLAADEDVELILGEDQDPTPLYTPKEVVVRHPASNGTRRHIVSTEWGKARKATKSKASRKAIIQRLRNYMARESLSVDKVREQAKSVEFEFELRDIRHWLEGDYLPGDMNSEKLEKFLEVADIAKPI